MIMLQCSTWRACGTGHREKHYEMITAPDRWMTSLTLSLLPGIYMHTVSVYVCVCVLAAYSLVCSYIKCVSSPACVYQGVGMCA